jgi:hypothetical protein
VASVVALNVLYRFVLELDEAADETRVPQLERYRYNEVLDCALQDVLGWCDPAVEIPSDWPMPLFVLRDAVNNALVKSDLVRSPERKNGPEEDAGSVWLAHPLIEECARPDDFQVWVRSQWDALAPDEQQALIDAASKPIS